MRARDAAILVRLPAALSVPGDTLAGMSSSATGIVPGRRLALPAASVLLYWAGMALNDYADRDLDRVERPERPIPSGRVHPGEALALAAGLTVAGVATAAWAGGRPAAGAAIALASTVWAYDLVLKNGPAGPAAMATARALDVVLGAAIAGSGPGPGAGFRSMTMRPVAAVGLHTAGVTLLSRGEVHGSDPVRAGMATAATLVAAATAASTGRRRPLALGLAAVYAVAVARAQVAAVNQPDAKTVRTATGAGIRGLVPLQAALLAGQGASRTALGLLALGPLLRAASRKVSPT
jgi:4-hydroxybenzoate polyprenyltransferase